MGRGGWAGGLLPGWDRPHACGAHRAACGWWWRLSARIWSATASMQNFIAARVMALDDRRATPAERLATGTIITPPINGSSSATTSPPSPGPARWSARCWPPSSAICPAFSGSSSARAWRSRAGFCHPVRLHAPRRQFAGPDGPRGDRQARRLHRADHGPVYHDHPARGGRAGGGQRARAVPGAPSLSRRPCPIAIFMGLYLRYWRPGKVLEFSAIGFVLVLASGLRRPVGGRRRRWAAVHAVGAGLAIAIIIYGFSPALCRSGCCWRRGIT